MNKVIPADAVLIPAVAKCVFRGVIFDVYQWHQKMFDGSTETFEMLKRPDTISVIAVVDNQILVLEEEQPHVGTRTNFPAGRVDKKDVSILVAAQREVREETGYVFKHWRLLEATQPHFKLEWFIHTYLAWGGQKACEPNLDPGEKIEVSAKPFDDVKKGVLEGDGFLGESRAPFEKAENLGSLLSLSEFVGKQVDR